MSDDRLAAVIAHAKARLAELERIEDENSARISEVQGFLEILEPRTPQTRRRRRTNSETPAQDQAATGAQSIGAIYNPDGVL